MAELLAVGELAPDVVLRQGREQIRLLDITGEKNVVLSFFVAAFTGG